MLQDTSHKTQYSTGGEARTSNPSISSLMLYQHSHYDLQHKFCPSQHTSTWSSRWFTLPRYECRHLFTSLKIVMKNGLGMELADFAKKKVYNGTCYFCPSRHTSSWSSRWFTLPPHLFTSYE